MPPEMRLGKISTYRRLTIEFTKEMNFPDTAEFIKLIDDNYEDDDFGDDDFVSDFGK